jgi:hypothetical protein
MKGNPTKFKLSKVISGLKIGGSIVHPYDKNIRITIER